MEALDVVSQDSAQLNKHERRTINWRCEMRCAVDLRSRTLACVVDVIVVVEFEKCS